MTDNEKAKVTALVDGCSTSNEIAGIVEMFAEQYKREERETVREDLSKLEAIAMKLDIRAAGGTSWRKFLDVLSSKTATEKYISYFENEIDKGCIIVVDETAANFSKVNIEDKIFILAPSA